MKNLNDYITEKLTIRNNTHSIKYDVDEIINGIIEYLSYEIDDQQESTIVDGKDLYVTKGLRIGINPINGKWKIGPEKDITREFDLTFNPEELTHVEQETFVTDDLEEKIRAALN